MLIRYEGAERAGVAARRFEWHVGFIADTPARRTSFDSTLAPVRAPFSITRGAAHFSKAKTIELAQNSRTKPKLETFVLWISPVGLMPNGSGTGKSSKMALEFRKAIIGTFGKRLEDGDRPCAPE